MKQLNLNDVMEILLTGYGQDKPIRLENEKVSDYKSPIYYVDEDAIWKLLAIKRDNNSSCGYSVLCQVESIYANGLNAAGQQYTYGEYQDFLFEDVDIFFGNLADAYKYRAKILAEFMSDADWRNDANEN